jgi:hypothetical protein
VETAVSEQARSVPCGQAVDLPQLHQDSPSDFWPILLLVVSFGLLVVLLTVIVFVLFDLSRRIRQLARVLHGLSHDMREQARLLEPPSASQQRAPASSTAEGTPKALDVADTRDSPIDVRTQLRVLQKTILSEAAKKPLVYVPNTYREVRMTTKPAR